MDFDIRPYNLAAGSTSWLIVIGVMLAIAAGLALLLAVARNGVSGLQIFGSGLTGYLGDIFSLSPKRVFALTKLTLLEAIRRKALFVFVGFAVLLMFSGWYLSDSNERPELQVQVHVTFLLTAIAWLLLPAVIFLSCWALPEDIRIRSLHTVVTKPARRVEIVIGRMLGMGLVTLIVLFGMGLVGYFWINRMIPEKNRNELTCRVPVFGELYFLSPEGQPSAAGINVGDVWAYRSHIAGNSQARAIWTFGNINEAALIRKEVSAGGSTATEVTEGLQLECRFEAFRTVKGSEKSIRLGVQAQYTLSDNPREEAFGMLSQGEALRPIADALRDAQFENASQLIKELAERIRTAPDELRPADYVGLQQGLSMAGAVLKLRNDEKLADVPLLFETAAASGFSVISTLRSNAQNNKSESVPYEGFASALDAVAGGLSKNASALLERLPKLEVPLPAFHISEYHEGAAENLSFIPRKLRFAADYETQGRFLAAVMEEWNAAGKLADGNALKSTLADDLAEGAKISPLNAELFVTVLQEQLSAGVLACEAGKLSVADGRSWFTLLDSLIRAEKLNAQDSEGWMIEKDLLTDLTRDGFLQVQVACLNDQMYLGMARPDLFIRKPDRAFAVGYSKALLNISLMLLLIIVLGVTVSCIVKGPVALFFTLTFFIVGQFFHDFMMRKLQGVEQGMGTLESAVLIAQHRNPQVGMDVSSTTQSVLKGADKGLEGILWGFSKIVPDFTVFNKGSVFVENGFDVPFKEVVLPAIAVFLGFLVPCILLAGALLKFRELEAK